MSDLADDTDARTERELELLIAAARRPALLVSDAPTGECYNGCGDPPMAGGNYCSKECADDSMKRINIKKRQGKQNA